MFVDFNSVFKKKTQKEMPIPPSLLEHMSNSLPDGLKYEALSDGSCHIIAESGNVSISGLVFKPTPEQKSIIGDNYTYDDVMKFSYNSQQAICFESQTPGTIIINGNSVPAEKFVVKPFSPIEVKKSSFYIMPSAFPAPFSVEVASPKYKRTLNIHRVANPSVDISKYESENNEPLVLTYYMNSSTKTVSLTASLKLNNARTIQDIVEAVSIYNAFIDGIASIAGTTMRRGVTNSEENKFNEESIVFWEKVMEIEKILDISFVPPKNDIDYKTMCLIEQLYQSLVHQKSTRESRRTTSISGEWNSDMDHQLDGRIGKKQFMIFAGEQKQKLLGVDFVVYLIAGQCNAIIANYTVSNGKYTIEFDDIDSDNPFFTAVRYFKTKDEMESIIKNNIPFEEEMLNAVAVSTFI